MHSVFSLNCPRLPHICLLAQAWGDTTHTGSQLKARLPICGTPCRGKFAKAESLETHPTNKEELPDGQNFKQAHDLLPQKKKKKKKKHKDQIGDPDAPNGLKVGCKPAIVFSN